MRMLSADLLLITEEHFIYKTFRFSSFPFRIELLEMLEQTVGNTLCSSRKCFLFLAILKICQCYFSIHGKMVRQFLYATTTTP